MCVMLRKGVITSQLKYIMTKISQRLRYEHLYTAHVMTKISVEQYTNEHLD